MKVDRGFVLVLLCFLLSGFAALVYQTAWTRQFSFVFGTSELAIATVLAAYMGGLSLGAAVAGRLAHRIRRPILAYGLLELGIGLTALAIPAAIAASTSLSVVLFGRSAAPPDSEGAGLAFFYLVCSFLILLIPTALMGATLPLLSRYAVRNDAELGRRIGWLYAINTLGAVAGTLLAGFYLLPALGLKQTLWVGVATNFAVFLVATLLARTCTPLAVQDDTRRTQTPWSRCDWILPMILVSGVTSFAYEVLWTRLINQILGGSVYAFSTMLASFLVGITLGSAVAARYANTREHAVTGFALSQIVISVCSLAAFACLDQFPVWALAWGGRSTGLHFTDVLLASALLLPSTLAIGATFPFAVRVTARGEQDAGPASARVYAWNTVGAIVGAVGAAFFVIPALAFAGSMELFIAINVGLAAAAAFLVPPRRKIVLAAAALVASGLVFFPPQTPWNLLRFSPLIRSGLNGDLDFYRVGRGGTVLLLRKGGKWTVAINGLPESGIRAADESARDLTNRWLGAVPSMARPQLRSMLVVGFGGGVVVEDVPASVDEVDVVELEPAVIAASRKVGDDRFLDPLADPRIHIVNNDARGALNLTDKRYGAIVSQPSHPWTVGASHLFTREFFELVEDHLESGGVFVQWIGLSLVNGDMLRVLAATLNDVFPYVRMYRPPPYGAVLFLASNSPLPVEARVEESVAASPKSFRRMGIQVAEDVAISLDLDEEGVRAFSKGARVSTDDENILQMELPRIVGRTLSARSADALLAHFNPLPRTDTKLDRIYLVDRMLMRRPIPRRIEALRAVDSQDGQRAITDALVEKAMGNASSAMERLDKVVAEGGAYSERARALLARFSREQIEKGDAAAIERVGSIQGPESAVIEGWQAANWQVLRELDLRLNQVPPRSPLYRSAVRLRARWRVESGEGALGGEALLLLDSIVAGTEGRSEDFQLRARAARLAGDFPTGFESLTHAIFRLPPGPFASHEIEKIRGILAEFPSDGSGPFPNRFKEVSSLLEQRAKAIQRRKPKQG